MNPPFRREVGIEVVIKQIEYIGNTNENLKKNNVRKLMYCKRKLEKMVAESPRSIPKNKEKKIDLKFPKSRLKQKKRNIDSFSHPEVSKNI